jgi:hypothetical protein
VVEDHQPIPRRPRTNRLQVGTAGRRLPQGLDAVATALERKERWAAAVATPPVFILDNEAVIGREDFQRRAVLAVEVIAGRRVHEQHERTGLPSTTGAASRTVSIFHRNCIEWAGEDWPPRLTVVPLPRRRRRRR